MLSLQTHELFESISIGNRVKVEQLVAATPELLEAVSLTGATPILFALYNGQREIAELLAGKKQLDVFEAASLGRMDRVRELVTRTPKVVDEYSKQGYQAVMLAAYLGQVEVVRYLLENESSAKAQAQNATGFTALTGAVSNGNKEIAELLISRGANVNHRYEAGFSPLMIAAEAGDVEMAKLLIAHGADVSAQTNDGKTPLSLAVEKGRQELATLLRDHGADK